MSQRCTDALPDDDWVIPERLMIRIPYPQGVGSAAPHSGLRSGRILTTMQAHGPLPLPWWPEWERCPASNRTWLQEFHF
ncbi:MAG: hypothetical protein HQL91_02135 [Magnetococcales bacterium]|nr:hypothetical protein [Magnetococcales bacterium]